MSEDRSKNPVLLVLMYKPNYNDSDRRALISGFRTGFYGRYNIHVVDRVITSAKDIMPAILEEQPDFIILTNASPDIIICLDDTVTKSSVDITKCFIMGCPFCAKPAAKEFNMIYLDTENCGFGNAEKELIEQMEKTLPGRIHHI